MHEASVTKHDPRGARRSTARLDRRSIYICITRASCISTKNRGPARKSSRTWLTGPRNFRVTHTHTQSRPTTALRSLATAPVRVVRSGDYAVARGAYSSPPTTPRLFPPPPQPELLAYKRARGGTCTIDRWTGTDRPPYLPRTEEEEEGEEEERWGEVLISKQSLWSRQSNPTPPLPTLIRC